MKTRVLPFTWMAVILSMLVVATASGFGPFYNPYDGALVVKTGKKQGTLSATANAVTDDGSNASVVMTGSGARGQRVKLTLALNANGTGTLTVSAKVLADKSKLTGNDKFSVGKKVVVKVKVRGRWSAIDANTAAFNFSGNSGRGGGTNVTGTFAVDEVGNMTLTFNSGFKQKVSGLGRRIGFSFTGASSTTPPPI